MKKSAIRHLIMTNDRFHAKKPSAALSSCAGSIFAWLAAYLHLKLT